jgi:hypothetical protein
VSKLKFDWSLHRNDSAVRIEDRKRTNQITIPILFSALYHSTSCYKRHDQAKRRAQKKNCIRNHWGIKTTRHWDQNQQYTMQANRLTLFLTVLQTASAEVFLRRHSQVTRATSTSYNALPKISRWHLRTTIVAGNMRDCSLIILNQNHLFREVHWLASWWCVWQSTRGHAILWHLLWSLKQSWQGTGTRSNSRIMRHGVGH